jgi:imidazolonepropionase-like amidohydrolase
MTNTTLIANGTIVTADGEFEGDVLIDGEKIAAVGRVAAPEGTEVVDASGCYVLPGLIDNHTHLSMPFVRRLRHGHAGRGRRRGDVPRRLRDPAAAGQPPVDAR